MRTYNRFRLSFACLSTLTLEDSLTDVPVSRRFVIRQFLTTTFSSHDVWENSAPSLAHDKLSRPQFVIMTIYHNYNLIIRRFVTVATCHRDELSQRKLSGVKFFFATVCQKDSFSCFKTNCHCDNLSQ